MYMDCKGHVVALGKEKQIHILLCCREFIIAVLWKGNAATFHSTVQFNSRIKKTIISNKNLNFYLIN
jgi:hypothetical protein